MFRVLKPLSATVPRVARRVMQGAVAATIFASLAMPGQAHATTYSWSSVPSGLFGCTNTQRSDNLYWQICLLDESDQTAPNRPVHYAFRAVMVASVASGRTHSVAAHINTVVNTRAALGDACPTKAFVPGTRLACLSAIRPYVPVQYGQGHGALDRDGRGGSYFYSPTQKLS